MDEVSSVDTRVIEDVAQVSLSSSFVIHLPSVTIEPVNDFNLSQRAKSDVEAVLAAIERSRNNPNENAEPLAVMYQILQRFLALYAFLAFP